MRWGSAQLAYIPVKTRRVEKQVTCLGYSVDTMTRNEAFTRVEQNEQTSGMFEWNRFRFREAPNLSKWSLNILIERVGAGKPLRNGIRQGGWEQLSNRVLMTVSLDGE